MRYLRPLLVAASLLLVACGSSSSASLPDGFYIQISNMSFSPLNLEAPPGATITVINDDAMDHTVTSEAAAGDYVAGSAAGVSFDTGAFVGDKSFTLPAGVPDGTVIPYFCNIHKASMTTMTGTITINSGAMPGPAPAGSSGNSGGGGGGGGGMYGGGGY